MSLQYFATGEPASVSMWASSSRLPLTSNFSPIFADPDFGVFQHNPPLAAPTTTVVHPQENAAHRWFEACGSVGRAASSAPPLLTTQPYAETRP